MAPFSWTSLIGPAIGLGGQVLGSKIAQGPQNRNLEEERRQFDESLAMKRQELNRRNAMFKLAAPSILGNLGYNSSQIPGMVSGMDQFNYDSPSPPPAATPGNTRGGGFDWKSLLPLVAGLGGGALLGKVLGGRGPAVLNSSPVRMA